MNRWATFVLLAFVCACTLAVCTTPAINPAASGVVW
jgi:hypothetical protein